MHALIIEDEPLVALSLQDALRGIGFTSFAVAATEDAAVVAAARRRPTLVTADLRLAAGCGLGAVRRIRDDDDVPVVFVTADGARLRSAEPDAVLVTKPFDVLALGRAVRAALTP